jgi:hypothetical protein
MRTRKFKHWFFENHMLLTAAASITSIILWASFDGLRNREFLFSSLGSVFGLSYFMLQQQLQEVQFFKELFLQFNERYGDLNEGLIIIFDGPNEQPLTTDERLLLYDYFNLCGEEFLYYCKGYIYPEVWDAWYNGMRVYAERERIRTLWKNEIMKGSYYGFQVPTLKT